MAETPVTKSANASVDGVSAMTAPQIPHLLAGVDIVVATPCEIRSDGKVYPASGAAADSHAIVAGWSMRSAKAGQTVTLQGLGLIVHYSDGLLTPAQILFLGTGGIVSSTASIGDTVGIAQAINDSDFRVTTK